MFYRTIGLLEAGIKPVFVFDGTPPELKLDLVRFRALFDVCSCSAARR